MDSCCRPRVDDHHHRPPTSIPFLARGKGLKPCVQTFRKTFSHALKYKPKETFANPGCLYIGGSRLSTLSRARSRLVGLPPHTPPDRSASTETILHLRKSCGQKLGHTTEILSSRARSHIWQSLVDIVHIDQHPEPRFTRLRFPFRWWCWIRTDDLGDIAENRRRLSPKHTLRSRPEELFTMDKGGTRLQCSNTGFPPLGDKPRRINS